MEGGRNWPQTARSGLVVVLRYGLSVSVLLAVWAFISYGLNAPTGLLAPPGRVFTSLTSEWSDFYARFAAATFYKAGLGGLIGVSAGLAVALTLGYSTWARTVFAPYLTIFQSFPREALYPIFVIAMGVGNLPQITNAALLSFFPVAVTMLHSLTDTRREYIELIRSWGGSRWQEFIHVRLPNSVPSFLGSLRLAVPFAIIGAVLAEMLGGSTQRGLGNLIVSAQAGQDATSTYAAIIILAVAGVAAVALLELIEYFLLRRFRQE